MEALRRRAVETEGSHCVGAAPASAERTGVVLAILCAVNGAFVPAVASITTRGAPPFLVTVLTSWFAALAAVFVLLWRGRLASLVNPGHAGQLVLLGGLGTTVAFTLFFAGASRSSAIETLLCLQIEPVYSLILSWLVLGVRPSRERVVATLLILSGLGLALGLQGFRLGGGTWYLLATPLCWQLSHLIVLRWLRGVPPDVLAAARYVWGGILLGLIAGAGFGEVSDPFVQSAVPWAWVAVQGLLLSYGGTMLWYGSLLRIDLARATVLVVPTVPLLSLVATFVLVGEVPSVRQLIGVLVAAGGVFLFARKGIREP
ncbi:MAG: hypothetical protein KatS3mg077_0260 [Candidatus Binatia bacterium]|nr:MAG: hypothetical protein KatS3mg077_0260 [Candidatus Binatia bacterium]